MSDELHDEAMSCMRVDLSVEFREYEYIPRISSLLAGLA